MAEDLEFLCQHLSLSEKEKGEIHVESTLLKSNIARGECCLVMSLLTNRYYNREALKNTMRKVWQPVYKVSIKDLGSKLFLVEFEADRDKQRALREGPWSFDHNLVLLKHLEGDLQETKIILHEASLWSRLYDMPLNAMNEEPLMRGITMNLGQFGSGWIRFAYERLPNFCYMCGKLGHQQKDCELSGNQDVRDTDKLPFGPWLHVGTTVGRVKANSGQKHSPHREFSPVTSSESERQPAGVKGWKSGNCCEQLL
ncbi:uncharacterized protein LOC121249349 [Juglans microcarpa x Juglans regia]|uniref:uncharacterized protein LOC121249349 n=1 Tax=Juglans microcarpa x Juglans regia TaxID=2249226 RepID=UPI001B7E8268|nr:uncharacterized protein LOC121249349 [Juglans microcarpa x Juglans regia]